VIERFARFASGELPAPTEETKSTLRHAVIDGFGCVASGASEEVAQKARSAFTMTPNGVPAYGTHERYSANSAAMVNGVAGHAVEYDDWELPGNSHPSIVMIPAVLAAAAGKILSGQVLADSYRVGFEMIARLGEALNFEHYDRGFHTTATLAAVGAAAASARALELDRNGIANAISLSLSRAIGYTSQFGTEAKPLQAGFAAETGVTAALLAQAGLGGQPGIFEHARGFNALLGHGDNDRFRAAFDNLGAVDKLEEHGLVFKPYPSCGYTHRAIDAALDLRARGLTDTTEITSIRIHVPDFHAAILPFGMPSTPSEGRFSLPFCIALALTRGDVLPTEFQGRGWEDPEIARLIELTTVEPFKPRNPLVNYDPDEPDRLIVSFGDGHSEVSSIHYPIGAPQNPMTADRIEAKFRTLTAKLDVSEAAIQRLFDWPKTDNIHDILKEWT